MGRPFSIIATDIDQTLVSGIDPICGRNLDAIAAAGRRGVRTVLTSGRSRSMTMPTIRELGLPAAKDCLFVALNGAAVYNTLEEDPLYFDAIEHGLVAELVGRGLALDVSVQVYADGANFLLNTDPRFRDYIKTLPDFRYLDGPSQDYLDLGFLCGRRVGKVILHTPDERRAEDVEKALLDLAGDVETSYSVRTFIEVNAKGIDKERGLLAVCDELGAASEDVIAIGDGANDIPLVRAAGLGCAVANASEALLPWCDYVCEANAAKGGVGEAIERFVLGR